MKKCLIVLVALSFVFVSCLYATTTTVDATTTYQTISGFGASSQWDNTFSSSLANTFWADDSGEAPASQVNGNCGLTILRLGIDDSGNSNWGSQCAFATQALKINPNVRVFASPWSPPAKWKNNNSVDGNNTGSDSFNPGSNTNQLNTSDYANYASYLTSFATACKNTYGFTPYAISVQNEPDYDPSYDACLWSPSAIDSFVGTYLGPDLANAGFGNIVMIPESFADNLAGSNTTMSDSNAAKYVKVVGMHLYGGGPSAIPSSYATTAGHAVESWCTEISEKTSDNNIDSGIYYANLLHKCIVDNNFNAFCYWWLVNINSDDEGLCDSSGNPTPRLYCIGNFSKFVRPGYVRIGCTEAPASGVLVSAYYSASAGKVVVVAINSNTSSTVSLPVSFNGLNVSTVYPWVTDSGSNLVQQSSVAVSNGSFTYTLPAESVVSFVGSTAAVTPQPTTPASTSTPTNTPTKTNTPVPPTNTFTSTNTFTKTNTPVPPTNTFTNTYTPTNTFTSTNTFTKTNTPVPPTNTFTNTNTPTNTFTSTNTFTKTNTPVPPTNTFTNTYTATNTPITPSATPTTPVPTNTPITPSATPTTPVPTSTPITPSATPTTPVPTSTPITPSATPTTPVPTSTPITPSATPTTPVPTNTPITPTLTPTAPVPTNTPIPTFTPTATTPASSSFTLYLQSAVTTNSTNSPHPFIELVNTGTTPLNLNNVEVRYWFNCDCTGQAVQVWVDWAGLMPAGTSVTGNIQATVVPTALGGQTDYISYKFTGNMVLQPGQNIQIQSRFNLSDWSNMLQDNDWSFAPYTSFTKCTQITGYLNGTLAWGQEPSSEQSAVMVANVMSYPNPSTSATGATLKYTVNTQAASAASLGQKVYVPSPGTTVYLRIYTASGRLIWQQELTGASYVSTGDHIVNWNGKSSGGYNLAPGSYILKIEMKGQGISSAGFSTILMLK